MRRRVVKSSLPHDDCTHNTKKITIQYSGGTVSEPFIDLTMQMMKIFPIKRILRSRKRLVKFLLKGVDIMIRTLSIKLNLMQQLRVTF